MTPGNFQQIELLLFFFGSFMFYSSGASLMSIRNTPSITTYIKIFGSDSDIKIDTIIKVEERILVAGMASCNRT